VVKVGSDCIAVDHVVIEGLVDGRCDRGIGPIHGRLCGRRFNSIQASKQDAAAICGNDISILIYNLCKNQLLLFQIVTHHSTLEYTQMLQQTLLQQQLPMEMQVFAGTSSKYLAKTSTNIQLTSGC